MKVFKSTLSMLFICLFMSGVQAQSVDDILKKYFENTGGLDKWKALKTITMQAKLNQGGVELPGTMYQKAPNKLKRVFEFQGQKFINAFDGTKGWNINPMGSGKAEPTTDEENKELLEEAEIESPFYNYKEKGHKVTLEGKETIEGTECFKIKLVKKNGTEETHFFDTENYVPVMERSTIKMGPAKGQVVESFLSDYKDAGGLMLPHSIQQKMGGQVAATITMTAIKINENIDDKEFAMPTN